jgi:hypothetical protein
MNIRYLAFDGALAHANVCPNGPGNVHGVNVPFNDQTESGVDGPSGLFHPNDAGQQALANAYYRLAGGGFFSLIASTAPSLPNGTLAGDECSARSGCRVLGEHGRDVRVAAGDADTGDPDR